MGEWSATDRRPTRRQQPSAYRSKTRLHGPGNEAPGPRQSRERDSCSAVLAKDERGVVAAESEGVGQRHLDVQLASALRDVIEVALRIWVLEVGGRRRH